MDLSEADAGIEAPEAKHAGGALSVACSPAAFAELELLLIRVLLLIVKIDVEIVYVLGGRLRFLLLAFFRLHF